jgi:uncharacterized protein (TIGR02246 family)
MPDTYDVPPAQVDTDSRETRSRTTPVVTGVLAVVLGAALVGCGSDTNASDAARVRALDKVERSALVAGDADAVAQVLASDFELVDPSGDHQTRSQYLQSVSSGGIDYQKFDAVSPVDVRVSSDVAVVTYESQLSVSAGAEHLEHRAWHTHVYKKRDGQWKQVWAQATAVGGFPPG